MANELDVMQMMANEIGMILDVLTNVNNITEKLQMQINMLNFKVNCLNERVNRIDPDYELIKSVTNPESKGGDDPDEQNSN